MNTEQEETWKQLMGLSLQGDRVAYERLLTEILPTIKHFCSRKIGFLGLTNGAAQESLIAIHRARHTYDPAKKFSPWLYALVRYRMLEQVKNWQMPLKDLKSKNGRGHAQTEAMSPLTVEDKNQLMTELEILDAKYRDALKLTAIEGLSISQAAQRLGISESVVKTRVECGLTALRKRVEQRLSG